MTFKEAVEVLTAIAVAIAAVYEARQLLRNPRDRALRVLVPGLLLLAFTLTAGLPFWPFTLLERVQDNIVGLDNIIWMTMAWCYAAFFLYADRARNRRLCSRLAAATFVGLLVAIGLFWFVRFNRPPGVPHSPRIPSDFRNWQNVVVNLAVYGFALAIYALGTGWAATYRRRLRNPWLRTAVGFVVVGAGAMTIGVDVITLVKELVLYVVFPGSRWPWLTDLYNLGRLGGQLLLAAGLLLAPAAALISVARQRRDQARQERYGQTLEPLWRRLTVEFPEVVLPSDRLRGTFERRTAEITDALSALAPYVPPAERAATAQPALEQSADMVESGLDARDRARRHGDVEDAWHEGPYPVIEPDIDGGWQARARWMSELAEHLEDHLTLRSPAEAGGAAGAGRGARRADQVSEEPAG